MPGAMAGMAGVLWAISAAAQPQVQAGAEDSLRRAAVPEDGRIRLADYGYRDWGPELVHYTVDTKRFRPGALVLLDAAGAAVPFQIDGETPSGPPSRLTFVASVPKGGAATYTLTNSPTDRSGEKTTLRCTAKDGSLELRNEHLAIRLPTVGEKAFSPAVDASQATPPILQWAGADGAWMGAARLMSARKVASQAFRLVRQGPACVEYEARYRFEPAGQYALRLRLSPGMPIAIVTEEFDLGAPAAREAKALDADALVLDLHAGWKPANVAWVGFGGEQEMPPVHASTMTEYLDRKGKAGVQAPPVGGAGESPAPKAPQADMTLAEKMVPAGKWGGFMGGVRVWDGEPAGAAAGRSIGLVTLSAGSWRRTISLDVWHSEKAGPTGASPQGAGLSVSLPIAVRYIRWSRDIADDFSPFSTHEHDRGLSATFGRRVWGLYAGSEIGVAQARFGYIGLDRYKDWIVDWPEPAGADGKPAPALPGAFFARDHVERQRKTLDQHPDGAFLRTWYLFSGKADDAARHAKAVIDGLKRPYGENDFYLVGLVGYRKSQMLTFVHQAEDALSCPDLPADLRRELRLRLALYANVTSEPDWNPRGAGVHLGNNNMTINRTLALTYFAGMLADHPRYAYWMDCAREFARFKFATQTAQDGAFIECPSYATYSPTRTLNISQIILRNRGVADLARLGYDAAFLRYLANLTMADPRFGGRRLVPGMGNSCNLTENIWGFCMDAFADAEPKFAGWLRYINRLANPVSQSFEKPNAPNYHDDRTPHAMFYLPDVPENPQPMTTTFMPAYGVAFRAHFGTPAETAALFRAGVNWSHWDPDYLNVILYGQGAPLSPGTGYQYYSGPATANNAVYHNQVKVARRDLPEVFGRVDAAVADYGFGPAADYAVADRYYPPEIFDDGAGEMHWRRHMMFLKADKPEGPSYFVLRDTFAGDAKRAKWWTWMNLDTPDRVAVDGKAFAKDAVALNKAVEEKDMPRLTGQVVEMKTEFGASTWLRFARPGEVRVRLVFDAPASGLKGGKEVKTILEVPAAGGEDYFYVTYPRRDGAEPPKCENLAAGVVRVTTAEGTDTVFIGDAPFAYDAADVVFTGKAGAVRVQADRVVLCMNAGSGKVGYKGYLVEGHGPFEHTVKLADLKPGRRAIEGGYAKQTVAIDLGGGVKVTGEGPLQARMDGQTVRITTRGRARVVHVTQPPFIVRPQYTIDGQEWMACWTDYPANGWGTYKNTWLIALSVPDGDHELTVKNLEFPRIWTRPFTPMIGEAAAGK